ncbi:MAG: glycosyltransferase family 4 protein [Chloroflexia bacterium]
MRIGISAHFWPLYTTGSGQYLRNLVAELARLETSHELLLIGERGAFSDGPPPVRAVELSLRPLPPGRPAKIWFEQVALPVAARRLDLDLLHVPYMAPPLFGRVPLVVTVHDLIPWLLPAYRGNLRKRAYTWLDLLATRRAQRLIAVSEHTARDIVRYLKVPRERIRVIHEAAAPGLQRAAPEVVERVRQKYGLPEQFVLYLGDIDRRKGLPTLLESFARWQARHPAEKVALAIAGPLHRPDGRLYPDLHQIARDLGIAQQVLFLGAVPETDKAALYSGAACFAFLSEYEGFGLPPIEAMACGTPVLAGLTSSLPEVVGDAGLLVDPREPEAVSVALERLLSDPSLREELARRGQARAARFSWRHTAQETMRTYESLLARSR